MGEVQVRLRQARLRVFLLPHLPFICEAIARGVTSHLAGAAEEGLGRTGKWPLPGAAFSSGYSVVQRGSLDENGAHQSTGGQGRRDDWSP